MEAVDEAAEEQKDRSTMEMHQSGVMIPEGEVSEVVREAKEAEGVVASTNSMQGLPLRHQFLLLNHHRWPPHLCSQL